MNTNGYPDQYDAWSDDHCYQCGGLLTEFPDEGVGPGWDGFCSTECQRLTAINDRRHAKGKPRLHIPHGLTYGLYAFLRDELGGDNEAIWSSRIYKNTACGAWLAVEGPDEVRIGSIVEGVDAECGTEELLWPFTREQFWDAVQNVEEEASEIWNDTHGCDRCAEHWYEVCGNREPGEHGMTPVWDECPDCDGDGVVI